MNYGSASVGVMTSMTGSSAQVGLVNPPSTRENLDFLGNEIEQLDKTSQDLMAKLDFFMEPERPDSANEKTPSSGHSCSELNSRILALAAHVTAIRGRLMYLGSRVN